MNKCKTSCKELLKKKKIYKVPDLALAYPLSYTPSIKILSQVNTGRSTVPTRETQSYASSPHTAREDFRSFQTSPFPKDGIKIDNLLRHSLKRFKSQKLELAKIKEFAEKWKKSRKKKIQDYNQLTRSENKLKPSSKPSRAKTAWESPDHKDRPSETPQALSKATMPIDRRANIGLEFYNLKSPRNTTPKNLQETKKVQKKNLVEAQNKKKIADFIKKKRKQRLKEEKKIKENEEELEIKRLAQLMKVERAAKKNLKKKIKSHKVEKIGKSLKNDEGKKRKKELKKVLKVLEETHEEVKKNSICFSEDEEVQNIMQVRKLTENVNEVNNGRQCLIFGEASESIDGLKVDTTDIVNKIMQGRVRSEDLSLVVSSSMPIIELKSISNESSSQLSEKVRLQRVEKMIQKLKSQEILGKAEKNPTRLVKSLQKLLRKRKKRVFLSIKSFRSCKPDSLSENLKTSLISQNHVQSPKEELDDVLNKYLQSREISEDLEKIWEKIETNYKKIETFNKPEDLCKTFKSGEGLNLNSEGSILETMKILQVPSLENTSLIDQSEDNDQEIESPSLLSIVSHSSELFEELLVFIHLNQALDQIDFEPEPVFPFFFNKDLIFIEEGKSINEEFQGPKESSFILTPESEEIEEFSSVNNFRTGDYVRPFNVSESTLMLDEEEIIEGTIHYLIKFIYLECVHAEVFEDFKLKNYQLLGNSPAVMQETCVFTSEYGIKQTSFKIWKSLNEDLLKSQIFDSKIHLFTLGNFPENLKESEKIIQKALINYENPDFGFAKIHNKCVFDLINSFLVLYRQEVNHPAWKLGKINEKTWNFNEMIKKFMKWGESFCRVCSGKIPTSDMVLPDGTLDEDLLQSVREQGLEQILYFDILEVEPSWIDYEQEENLMKTDVADIIVSDLIEEIEEFLQSNLINLKSLD